MLFRSVQGGPLDPQALKEGVTKSNGTDNNRTIDTSSVGGSVTITDLSGEEQKTEDEIQDGVITTANDPDPISKNFINMNNPALAGGPPVGPAGGTVGSGAKNAVGSSVSGTATKNSSSSIGDAVKVAGRTIASRLLMAIWPANNTVDADGNPAGEMPAEDPETQIQKMEALRYAYNMGYAQAINDAKKHDGERIAVIGEGQLSRVVPYAATVEGLTFSMPDRLLFESGWASQFSEPFRHFLSIQGNRGWINGVMNSGYQIHDIGPVTGQSPWYAMEVMETEIRGYPRIHVSYQ